MGFYGNITNTSKTNFVFDKIYSNRTAMESNAATDGVFIGRYVLIEYGTKTPDSFIRAYGPDDDGWYYTSPNQEAITRIYYTNSISDITDTNIYSDMIIYIQENQKYKYLICTGGNTTNKKPRFEETNVDTDLYYFNKNQDAKYQNSRGYDGTVWVKTSVEENGEAIIKYVNIAELNTVVPTFDIAYDAPTLYPITPHFDTDSNNVYYKLHMQPQWGLKIKNAAADGEGSDGKTYNSDESVRYTIHQYNPATDEDEEKTEDYQGAIYYNKTGFNIENSNSVDDTNIISVMPTGKSGQEYNTHDDNYSVATQIDTQEIIIQLPTIGNTISKVWDIIYDTTDVQKGRRFRDVEWKYTNDTDKNGDDTLGGMTRNLSTIAGCINSVHDLMGMIIYKGRPKNIDAADADLIYFDNGKYYRIGVQYDITRISTVLDEEYFVEKDDNNIFTPGTIWNNEVKTIPKGVTLVTRNEQRAWIEMDLANELDTIHGWILKLNKYFVDDSEGLTRNRKTLQGTLNYLNDIIDKFDKLVPGEFVVVDEYGRMQSAGYTTQQAYTSKNYGQSIDGTSSDAYPLSENRWIDVDIETKHEEPFITITHNFTPVKNNTTTTSDKNDPEGKDGINNSTNDDLYLYAPIVDSVGHVVGKNIETVTLPYSYKTFTTKGLGKDENGNEIVNDLHTTIKLDANGANTSSSNALVTQTVANNTQDSMAIEPFNKWIQTELSNDKLVIAHEIHAINTEKDTTDLNDLKDNKIQNEINIPDWDYDEAGHIKKKGEHTYTLPYGFKTINVGNDTSESAAPAQMGIEGETADNTQDSLTFVPTNKWIKMVATGNNEIKFGHEISDIEAKEHSSSDPDIADFGDTFNILKFTTDKAGHVTAVGEESVKIPSIVFTNDTTGNVVTNMAYSYNTNDKKGTFTETRENIGTLALGTHTSTTITTNGLNILNTDTVSGAFNKVQTHINSLNLTSTNSDLEWVTDITQANGQIAIARKGTDNLKLNNYSALSSVSSIGLATNDTLNNAFGKLEYRIKEEEKNRAAAIEALDVPDTEDDTKYVSGVSETNGKISVLRKGTDTLKLNNYTIATASSDVANGDTINSAFGKIQKQIKDIYGSEEIATNFDTIKDIADWLVANDSNADKIIDSIATLNGNDTVSGSVANSIKTAIEGLDSSKSADTNKYISGITITNGKITEIQQTALGSAAYTESSEYAKLDTKFDYGTTEQKTIADLMDKVAELETELNKLKNQINPPQEPDEGGETV